MTSPVVDQCVVIGDRKPFIAAIVSLNLDETNAWLAAQGVEQVSDLAEAVRNPIVYAEVERAVNAANDLVSRQSRFANSRSCRSRSPRRTDC